MQAQLLCAAISPPSIIISLTTASAWIVGGDNKVQLLGEALGLEKLRVSSPAHTDSLLVGMSGFDGFLSRYGTLELVDPKVYKTLRS
jgi:hypothetical protein